ncbi:SANT/Myb-like DNA-binding domain-containing protein [Paracoccus wurundjeri]|uniref:SANT/Myb-like DNA-binding domain-containing protein n=1 Tax=Paracoccus onubensis TaxID=1675788 RepID=UPI00272F179A|nr:SANT/Myb-like DNA-binding domain-containing protein [Paracoccus onubensis]
MTLSIEINLLRGLNERCPQYSFDRGDLIDLAEYVAGEIARVRQSDMLLTEILKPVEPAPPSAEAPDVQPEPPESQPETVISQPDTPPAQQRKDAWTEKQDDKLIQMKRAGCTIAAMAKQIDRSGTAVRARIQKLKATKPSACAFGRTWSEQDDEQLIRLKMAGMTWGAIAAELDRTSRSAEQRYLRLKKAGAVTDQKDSSPMPEPVAETPKPQSDPKPITPAPLIVRDTTRVSDIGDLSHLTIRQRALVMHLANLNDDFAPIDDLDIIEGLMEGKKTTVIADELGCRPDDVNKRWRAMLTTDVVNHHGTPTIDGQQDVLAAARHLVKCVEGAHG